MRCWVYVPVPAASDIDRTESFYLIAWLYLNPANPRTSQTGLTTYLGKNLSTHRKSRWREQCKGGRENCRKGGKGGDQEGLWPQTVQEIRIDPSWATWEVWIRWQEAQERPCWRGCMVAGLTKWGSAGLSYSDPSQHSDKVLCKLSSIAWEEVYEFRATTDTGDICKNKASPGSKVRCHGRLETVTSIYTSIFFFFFWKWVNGDTYHTFAVFTARATSNWKKPCSGPQICLF